MVKCLTGIQDILEHIGSLFGLSDIFRERSFQTFIDIFVLDD